MTLFQRIKKSLHKTKTFDEYVRDRIKRGESPKKVREELLKDLEEGGKIFGEFKKAFQPTFTGSINRFGDTGVFGELGKSVKYVWSACKVKKDPVCPDCLKRDGKSKSWEEWEKEGLPRTGATACKKNCKCILLPAEVTKLKPIDELSNNSKNYK